jgi:hypothetical protein
MEIVMESINSIGIPCSDMEDLDYFCVNPNIIRPKDTMQLLRELALLPFSLKPDEVPPEAYDKSIPN